MDVSSAVQVIFGFGYALFVGWLHGQVNGQPSFVTVAFGVWVYCRAWRAARRR